MKVLFSVKDDWATQIVSSLDGTGFLPTFAPFTDQFIEDADIVFPLRIPDTLLALDSKIATAKSLLPSREALTIADHKMQFNRFLVAIGFSQMVPAIYRDDRIFPYILKGDEGEWGNSTYLIRDARDEAAHRDKMSSPKFFAQEYVAGHEESALHIVSDGSKIRYAHTVRYSYAEDLFVKGPIFKPARVDRLDGMEFEHVFTEILAKLKFQGVCCINYKTKNGVPQIMELNPRMGASLADRMREALPSYIECVRGGC